MPEMLGASAAFLVAYGLARRLIPALARFLRDKGLLAGNYLGEQVPCPLGLAVLASAAPVYALFALGPLLWTGFQLDAARLAGLQAAVYLTALAGLLDDLAGKGEPKGLRGHFAALRQGRLTAGALKAAAGGLAGLVAGGGPSGRTSGGGLLEWAVDAGLIALSANAMNSLDLRPGRAAKAFLATAAMLGAGGGAPLLLMAPFAGAVAGYLPWDLRRRGMLGDTGANPLGAALGAGLAWRLAPAEGAVVLLLLGALHVLTERSSLTARIEANRLLRRLDMWGRRA